MKIKHNKKRNTAFVYEALIKEATISILKNDLKKRKAAISVIKKHFYEGSTLRADLECYRSLGEKQNLDRLTCEKILKESKLQKRMIDPSDLFNKQTELIHDINKEVSPSVFNNFVPNYKSLATIAQIFSDRISPKSQVILENQIIIEMLKAAEQEAIPQVTDDLVFRSFVTKFNDKYNSNLLNEQKELLNYYISSFVDNSLQLKIFLNEEIGRLKEELARALSENSELQNDTSMHSKTEQLIEKLNSFAKEGVSDEVLLTVLKTQQLVKEIYSDGDYN
tara:strand:- start:43 stop:879 length:837 start_codon:yes stop_codon:yes gene_type:complete